MIPVSGPGTRATLPGPGECGADHRGLANRRNASTTHRDGPTLAGVDDPAPEHLPVPDPDRLRASDQDRHRVAERLHSAAAEGRLTLDELGERLETLYTARTHGELVPLTRDLPDPVGRPAPVAATGTSGGQVVSVAVMSGCDRTGEWVVPAQHTALAFMGGINLDLRHAVFAAPRVTITAVAIMGGIEITVPHDMDVEVTGIGFMGAFEGRGSDARPGGVRVRVNGIAFMGGVEVKRADPVDHAAAVEPEK